MKSRRQDVLPNTGRITRSKTLLHRGESSLPIPIDLVFDIFSRLPAKSIAKCRCVSKFWASILRLPYFTELFLRSSSTRPQLLFACQGHGELLLFSLPHLENSDENSSIVVDANYHTKFSFSYGSSEICAPVRGLIYLGILNGRKGKLPVICNPSTGQTLKLPKLKTRIELPELKTRRFISGRHCPWYEHDPIKVRCYLGYDPIGKQLKLLSMAWTFENYEVSSMEYQVMTLGSKKLSWRKVECSMTHCPGPNGICINGRLYYGVRDCKSKAEMIHCFHVRSEKYSFINRGEDMKLEIDSTLVNHNGKLGALVQDGNYGVVVTEESRGIELWVLEDSERHEWSKHIHLLPPLWKDVVGARRLSIVGMIGMNEIVLASKYQSDSDLFYVYYFNIEKNIVVRVGVQGLEAFRNTMILPFLNHVENVELMQDI